MVRLLGANDMESLSHIERSGFRRGEYVGYDVTRDGQAVKIKRGGAGWMTYSTDAMPNRRYISCRTLAELNRRLQGGTR